MSVRSTSIINMLRALRKKLKKHKKNIDREYFFGEFKIYLKSGHVLDKYQKDFPLYDRFLPLLCQNLEGLIIDVGANIGDTSIAIFSKNPNSFIVGVEPDSVFYDECISNININHLVDRFLGVKKFVSTKNGVFKLEKDITLSTGSISSNSVGAGESNTISFTQLMDLVPSKFKMKFDILKIDTDGFDWDVLDSFAYFYNNVSRIKPRFIFFEMQTYLNNNGFEDVNRDEIINNYKISIEKLQTIGYNNFYMFDNFGTPIKMTQSVNEILAFNEYIQRSQIYNSHSTIFYIDVLAFSNPEIECVDLALNKLYDIVTKAR